MSTTDNSKRLRGTVEIWNQARNFGWIKKSGSGDMVTAEDGTLDKKDLIFVHTSQVTQVSRGESKFYNLPKGLEVEFTMEDTEKGPRALNVTLPGGENIVVDTEVEIDMDKKTTYTGSVIFYNSRKGFGFIKPDTQVSYKGIDVDMEKGIFVASSHIHAERPFRLHPDTKVQFKAYKDGDDRLAACEVEGPDGEPLKSRPKPKEDKPEGAAAGGEKGSDSKQPGSGSGQKKRRERKPKKAAEDKKGEGKGGETGGENKRRERKPREEKIVNPADKPCEVAKSNRYSGNCRIWSYGRRFGFITPDNMNVKLNGEEADLSEGVYVHRTAILAETSKGQILAPGQRVSFTLEKSEKGFSAAEVTQDGDLPVTFDVYKKAQSEHRKKQREEKAAKKAAEPEAEQDQRFDNSSAIPERCVPCPESNKEQELASDQQAQETEA